MRAASPCYSLIEVTVAMAIAIFLLGRPASPSSRELATRRREQTGLSELQDEQRLATTMITDIVQSAGFFTDPKDNSAQSVLLADGGNFTTNGQALYGTTATTTGPDTLTVRFQTGSGDTVLNCNGTSNNSGSPIVYSNTFSVAVNAAGVSQLLCLLSTNGVAAAQALPLVNNVTNLQFWYAVNTTDSITTTSTTSTGGAAAGSFTNAGCPADTYIATTDMAATDWTNVCAVRVLLTFVNPLYQPPGQPNPTKGQPPTIQFARVMSVLGKGGPEHDERPVVQPQRDPMITTTSTHPYGRQHGMALITALLLLLVITILGVAMFRSNGLEQRIGGNTRDKERAFHAANADLAVAEQHLVQNDGVNATTGSTCTGVMSVSSTVSLVCSNAIQSDVQDVPWPSYVQYTPPNMSTSSTSTSSYGTYSQSPAFYISFVSSTPGSRDLQQPVSDRRRGLRR